MQKPQRHKEHGVSQRINESLCKLCDLGVSVVKKS